jgi:PPOX class probable F420-dependent enzyme
MSMTPEEMDAFLAEPRLCHFATVDERAQPRVRPLWYLWREGAFWLTTRREARHTGRDLAGHPRVAISVADETRPYRAVVAHGTPEILKKDRDILLAISTRYGQEQGRAWTDDEAMQQSDRVVMRLVPETLVSWDYGKDE